MTLLPTADSMGDLEEVCRNVIHLLNSSPRPPHRMKLTDGRATVEVEWALDAPWRSLGGANGQADLAPAAAISASTEAVTWAVLSPMVGTFFRAPEPGKPPFVELGDRVQAGQILGIVEAMKLMNPIEAERDGIVAEILAGNAEFVEFGQPLLALAPIEHA